MNGTYDYGLWPLVVINVGLGLAFLWSYFRPARRREWRSLGVASAFIVALFSEMYGFPLTIYLLTAVLGRTPFPNAFAHSSGNLWASVILRLILHQRFAAKAHQRVCGHSAPPVQQG